MSGVKRVIALTGATGFVGSYLARTLVRDASIELRASRRASSSTHLLGAVASQIDWVTGDLLNHQTQDELVRGAEALIHCAGLVSYAPGMTEQLTRVNRELTADLVNACLSDGPSRFIHMSSIAAISPAGRTDTISESELTFHPTVSTTRYALAKHAAELEVWRGSEEGLEVTVLNPSVILGGGYWDRSSSRLFAWVDQGQRFFPKGSTGYVDVRDVAAFAKTCLTDPQTVAQRYVLNAANWPYRRFFDTVAESLGVTAPSTPVNEWQAELAWRGEALRSSLTRTTPLLTKESARRSMSANAYDNAKSLAAGASYRDLEQTIAETAQLYRSTREQGWGILPLD